jgi:hypothetical protein
MHPGSTSHKHISISKLRLRLLFRLSLGGGILQNAQPRFFESSSKLLQIFVTPKSQIKERILERIVVKVERLKKDHA